MLPPFWDATEGTNASDGGGGGGKLMGACFKDPNVPPLPYKLGVVLYKKKQLGRIFKVTCFIWRGEQVQGGF